MQIQLASLNSGSNGNCYYIGNAAEAVLIDAGLSCRETEKRMRQLELDIKKVKAIFISHEHKDHISGAGVLSKKYQLPVYITRKTLRNCWPGIESHLVHSFTAEEKISMGTLIVTAFTKSHDANDPHSFIIQCGGTCIGVFTDIGHACKTVTRYFRQCHAVFLESNYDANMLANGNYPVHLQKRISGGKGHLSNTQALQLFCENKWEGLRLLILSHLSENNNTENLVQELFENHAGDTKIYVASRYSASPVFSIEATLPRRENISMIQMRLFG